MRPQKLREGSAEFTVFDVGQGSSSVLRLDDDSLVILDAGPDKRARKIIDYIHAVNPTDIHAIVVSHNDRDHINGILEILYRFGTRVRSIWMLEDRDLSELNHLNLIFDLVDRRVLASYPLRAELGTLGQPVLIFESKKQKVMIALHYPDWQSNLQARKTNQPNLTSTIVSINVNNCIVWVSGDAPFGAWKELSKPLAASGKLVCDVFVVPHHGGRFGEKATATQGYTQLFDDVLTTPSFAAISAGSKNSYGHPHASCIKSLRSSKYISCTEMTDQCCASTFAKSSHENGIECYGDIIYLIDNSGVDLRRQQKAMHQEFVRQLGTPLCK